MKNYNILNQTGFLAGLVIIVTFIAGSSFVMWMGEQIHQFGIGNGISIILFAGIISRSHEVASCPPCSIVSSLASGAIKWWHRDPAGHRHAGSDRSVHRFMTTPSAASPCSTPSVRWAARCTAARAHTCP